MTDRTQAISKTIVDKGIKKISCVIRLVAASCLSLAFTGSILAQQARRIPGQTPRSTASVAGTIQNESRRPIGGVTVQLRNQATHRIYSTSTNGEGIYRLNLLPSGNYDLVVERTGFTKTSATFRLTATQLRIEDFQLQSTLPNPAEAIGPTGVPGPPRTSGTAETYEEATSYPGLRLAQPIPVAVINGGEAAPPENATFGSEPYRWAVEMPEWHRYQKRGEFPYTRSRWYDPFNRNRLKGDLPIFGQQWFLDFTGISQTGVDGRRLPTASNISTRDPGSRNFFGRDQQAALSESVRLTFDLFRGDTSFRPASFRLRFTPAFNVNFLQSRELGVVNVDVRQGTNRLDTHIGLQEGFVEAKIYDLSSNFDFVSVRAGIQAFTSDFRGFIFSDEQPGVRLFGNLFSNRLNYNLAYFYLLEKDTNSGLNTFAPRHQQVGVANAYIQDFFAKGYTTEFSFHYNFDQADIYYDKNGFLVRPAPIGTVVMLNGIPRPHSIRSYYLGWTGNGHIKHLNISHAFYQALGNDDFNSIAGRPVNINAQMGALELSVDHNWLRFRTSAFFASGDSESRVGLSRSSTARGFDSIVDDTQFAGGQFSFWDREGIRLSDTGVALTTPFSLLPSLRASKEEGQSNFVNPGVRLYNVGVDANITPKLRGFINTNYLQFDRVEPLTYLLFQPNISRNIGTDCGLGISYRPPLTENIVLTTGVSALIPSTGFRDIYDSKVLVSGFANLRIQF